MDPSRPPPGARPVARLGRAHGLHGAVRVQPFTDADLAALRAAERVWIAGLGEARVLSLAAHGRGWLLRVDRLRDVDDARRRVHAEVRVVDPVGSQDETDGAHDLAGLPVEVDGRPWGEVVGRAGAPANPLAVVRGPAGDATLPLAAPYVQVEDDRIVVRDPPAGLLEPS
jgi:ribosomal 30S subunit maturation factor RimM